MHNVSTYKYLERQVFFIYCRYYCPAQKGACYKNAMKLYTLQIHAYAFHYKSFSVIVMCFLFIHLSTSQLFKNIVPNHINENNKTEGISRRKKRLKMKTVNMLIMFLRYFGILIHIDIGTFHNVFIYHKEYTGGYPSRLCLQRRLTGSQNLRI